MNKYIALLFKRVFVFSLIAVTLDATSDVVAQEANTQSAAVERTPSWTEGTMSMQDLANRAHKGEELLQELQTDYQRQMQTIFDDPGIRGDKAKMRAINLLENEYKRQKISIWAQRIEPFNQAVMNEVNQGLAPEDTVRPTAGSQLFAKDKNTGKLITESLNNGAGQIKVYNGTFKASDLDIGVSGKNSREVAKKVDETYRKYGFSPSNVSKFSADYDGARVTINISPDDYPPGSYRHRAEITAQANNYESFVSHSCKKFNNECPGKQLVKVNDVNSKGLKYLHGDPQDLIGFENQERLSNAAKSTWKAIEAGKVTDQQLERIAQNSGFTPKQFKKILQEVKENGRTFAGAGLTSDNISDFQGMARAVTQQAVTNAETAWIGEKNNLAQQRQNLIAEFDAARKAGVPEDELSRLRGIITEMDSVVTDAEVRIDATTAVNNRVQATANSKSAPSKVSQLAQKVYNVNKNVIGAAGSWLGNTARDQATKSSLTLAESAKDALKPGLLSSAGHALDAYSLYKCSQDPDSLTRQVCYWENGTSVAFQVFSDIGVAGSVGVGAAGTLGTGTVAGLVTVGAPIVVTALAGGKVKELVGEVQGGRAAELRAQFNNSKAEERLLAALLARESAARKSLEDFRATGDWRHLRKALEHSNRLRRVGKISGDTRFNQSADLIEKTANEYSQVKTTGVTQDEEFDFEEDQMVQVDESDITNLRDASDVEIQKKQGTVGYAKSDEEVAFDGAERAISDHQKQLQKIKELKAETAQIYAQIEEKRARREQERREFWKTMGETMGALASGAAAAASVYAEQQQIIEESFQPTEIEEDSQTSWSEFEVNDQYLQAYNPCARYRGSDYERCVNDPCSDFLYDMHLFHSCRGRQFATQTSGVGEVPVVKSEHMHQGECSTRYHEGAEAPEQYSIPIEPGFSQLYTLDYEHYGIKDRTRLYFNGRLLKDTQCTRDGGKWELPDLSAGGQIKIIIDPHCDPTNTGATKWWFELNCPSTQ